MRSARHKVFISYNSRDAARVRTLAGELESRGIKCWLDTWALAPGTPWQEEIEAALARARVILVAIGPAGLGRWHTEELRAALQLRVEAQAYGKRVIPVLLPGAAAGATESLPLFLRGLTVLDLGAGDYSARIATLVAAIGERRSPRTTKTAEATPHLSDEDSTTVRRLDRIVRRCTRWAQAVQNADGGMPSDNPGSLSCTWASAGLLWAIHASGLEAADTRWLRRGVTWLLDNMNNDGGVPVVMKGDPSIVDATAQTLLASLPTAVATGNERMIAGCKVLVAWLVDHQQRSGGWTWRPGHDAPWTASTAFALLALESAAKARFDFSVDVRSCMESAIKWLLMVRNADSGWGQHADSGSHPAITGLVAHCLAICGHPSVPDESVDYLLDSRLPTGEWPDAIDRPLGTTIIRFGTPYAAIGIGSCIGDAVDAEIADVVTAILTHYYDGHFTFADSSMHTWPTRDCVYALSVLRRRYIDRTSSSQRAIGERRAKQRGARHAS
jgi:hypothetical protein